MNRRTDTAPSCECRSRRPGDAPADSGRVPNKIAQGTLKLAPVEGCGKVEVEGARTAALPWTVQDSRKSPLYRTMPTSSETPGPDRRPRRPHPQPQERRPDAARPVARRHDRRQRVGQVVARLRHDLRRGAAPLRRIAVGLRPAVPRADGEAGRRLDRGHLSGDRDPPEEQHPQSAVDRRARPPRSTTTCACSTRASAGRICRNCGREVIRETAEVVARRLGELPEGTRLLIGFDMPVVTVAAAAAARRTSTTRSAASAEGADEPPSPQPDLPDLVDPDRRDARRAPAQGLRPAVRRRPDRTLEDVDPATLQGSRRRCR